MSLEVANEFIGGILTMTMDFVQGWRGRYDLSMWGDPLMSERDDKWGIWEFDPESNHLDETGPKRIAKSIGSENLKDKKWASWVSNSRVN